MRDTHAYILDLDGTLMPSDEVDNRLYWRAVRAVFGEPDVAPSLEGFTHVTDPGILDQWCRENAGRPPTTLEIESIKARFLTLTREAAATQPGDFEPFPGLRRWLQGLLANDHPVAVATGGWGHTARFKLSVAGLDRLTLPLASADDASSRTDIMRCAWQRLAAPAQVTYIGDGPWDKDAAEQLGWGFIGRASGAGEERLRAAGAGRVIADFTGLSATGPQGV